MSRVTKGDVDSAITMCEIMGNWALSVDSEGPSCIVGGHCPTCQCARDGCGHVLSGDCVAVAVGASDAAAHLATTAHLDVENWLSEERTGIESVDLKFEHDDYDLVDLGSTRLCDGDEHLEAAQLLRDGWLPPGFMVRR